MFAFAVYGLHVVYGLYQARGISQLTNPHYLPSQSSDASLDLVPMDDVMDAVNANAGSASGLMDGVNDMVRTVIN